MLPPREAAAAARAEGFSESLADANIMRFALRHPKLARLVVDLIDMVVVGGTLDARLREIAILRVGWRIGSVYEWSNHVPIARRAGMSDTEIVAVRDADGAVLTPADLLAIRVADEVLDHDRVSAATLAEARSLLGDGDALVELVAIPGSYRLIGSLLHTFHVPLEAHVEPWAPDGTAP